MIPTKRHTPSYRNIRLRFSLRAVGLLRVCFLSAVPLSALDVQKGPKRSHNPALTPRSQLALDELPTSPSLGIATTFTAFHRINTRNFLQTWPRYAARQAIIWATRAPSADPATSKQRTTQVRWMQFESRQAKLRIFWILGATQSNRTSSFPL